MCTFRLLLVRLYTLKMTYISAAVLPGESAKPSIYKSQQSSQFKYIAENETHPKILAIAHK